MEAYDSMDVFDSRMLLSFFKYEILNRPNVEVGDLNKAIGCLYVRAMKTRYNILQTWHKFNETKVIPDNLSELVYECQLTKDMFKLCLEMLERAEALQDPVGDLLSDLERLASERDDLHEVHETYTLLVIISNMRASGQGATIGEDDDSITWCLQAYRPNSIE